jgi:hypothetical protein
MEQIHLLTEDLPADRVAHVRYEDFCTDPRRELTRLCKFFRLEFEESMLARATTNVHHLGGSPSKYDPGRIQIRLDRSYEGAFTAEQFRIMRELAGDPARRWGY